MSDDFLKLEGNRGCQIFPGPGDLTNQNLPRGRGFAQEICLADGDLAGFWKFARGMVTLGTDRDITRLRVDVGRKTNQEVRTRYFLPV